jgi:multidrug efflux pump subunit AcrA (membrane-fusion protein)
VNRLAVLAVVACACGGDEAAVVADGVVAREAKVARGELTERVLLTGQLRAANSVDLNVPKTEVWQLTIRWMAEDGASVKAGDKVLEFDNSSFTNGLQAKYLQLLEAQSSFRTFKDLSTMNLAVKDFELQQHRVALDKAKLMATVPADLSSQRTAQERLLEKTRAEVAVTRAEQDLATERQASALEARVKQIELDKAKRAIEAAERNIDELVLTAPRDGVMLVGTHPWMGKRFQIGDTVQPGFTIVTLPDLSQPMQVRAELSDVDDGKLALGAKGTCTLDAYPREPIPCSVSELAPVARTNSMESLRRVFSVTLQLERSDPEKMRPGMSVKVELRGPTTKHALVVPRGALVRVGAEARLRTDSGLREIKLAGCDAQRCAIDSGVTEGDVVLEGGP